MAFPRRLPSFVVVSFSLKHISSSNGLPVDSQSNININGENGVLHSQIKLCKPDQQENVQSTLQHVKQFMQGSVQKETQNTQEIKRTLFN